ncbi:hypothetical protein CRG98_049885 [Punica granatum]|uniref:Uncharacterized protein n=1 Tax=Punica granatum TaxID=22663 RepID=A0A2I0H2H3_PUNGR|nr:hypothetical protein CRG98_049885 [Punica granatum]
MPVLMVQGTKKKGKDKRKGKKAKGKSKCDSGALKPKAKDLRNNRSLAKGEVDLRVENGVRVAALAVGTYHLSLPTRLELDLDDCYYVPTVRTRMWTFVGARMCAFEPRCLGVSTFPGMRDRHV